MAEEIKYFSNSKEELEYYKKNYKSNAEELSSCKSKIKVLENINSKLKEKITLALSSTTDNNDTSNFFSILDGLTINVSFSILKKYLVSNDIQNIFEIISLLKKNKEDLLVRENGIIYQIL